METIQAQRPLPCKLTSAEFIVAAEQLAAKMTSLTAEEKDQEAAKAAMKSRLQEIEREVDRLVAIVRTKTETRMVDTHTRISADVPFTVETVRNDTGEVIERRAMTLDERNMPLFPTLVRDSYVVAKADEEGS